MYSKCQGHENQGETEGNKEAGQLNVWCDSEMDPFSIKDILGQLEEFWESVKIRW